MSEFKPRSGFDTVFEVGIIFKGLHGLFETVSGTLLLFLHPDKVTNFVHLITRDELRQDKHDIIASHLIHWSQHLTRGALLFGGIYLMSHGIAKLVLVIEILRNHLWAYIGLIVLTALFIVYQTYEYIFNHSVSLMLLNIFDIIILYLTIREYKIQIKRRHKAE